MPPMNHTVYILDNTQNEYGDYTATVETSVRCHFREITDLQHNSSGDSIQSDAMAWFEPDAPIERGTIVKFDGTHYKVERITVARRLHATEAVFIKTELMKYGPIS